MNVKTFDREEINLTRETLEKSKSPYKAEFDDNVEPGKILLESEMRFRKLYENGPLGITFIGKDFRFINSNQSFCSMIGYTEDELRQKTIKDITHPDSAEDDLRNVLKLIKGEIPVFKTEKKYIRKNGSIIWASLTVTATYDEMGNFLYTVAMIEDISERIKYEQELKESQHFLNQSQYISKIGSYKLNIKTGIWTGSAYLDEMFGMSPQDDHSIEGWIALIHPDDRQMMSDYLINEVIGQKKKFDKDYRVLSRKSEEIKWVHGVGELDFDDKGNPIRMTGTIQDITDRKRDEEIITLSEEKFRTLIEFAPDAFFHGDNEGNFIMVNERALELTGFTSQELLGKNMSYLFLANELNEHPLRYDLLLKGKIITNERKIVRKNGMIIAVEMTSRMLPDGTFQSFLRDITERQKIEDEIITLTQAIHQSPNSIVITNTKGEIEYINPVVEKLSGYSRDELIGQNPSIFSSGKTTAEEYKNLWNTITKGEVWHGEFQNKTKDGELYWESAIISPVKNRDGNITHYMAIREDITEKKKMTEELIKAKEKAEESNRLKTSFLANMSHEIRTPMNSIMGFASLLPEEESRELMIKYANIIVQNSEQLVSLIDGIVMYSKLQTGLFVFRPSTFTLNSLMDDIQLSFNLPIYQGSVSLLFQFSKEEDLQIKSDYDKLRQVLTNLISNAFKYTFSGNIICGFIRSDDAILFFVKDTGIGIPERDIEHVFERFYRGSNINESQMRGTGLGLCIVKELVDMLGGIIWVESTVNLGTTFNIKLPLQL